MVKLEKIIKVIAWITNLGVLKYERIKSFRVRYSKNTKINSKQNQTLL